MVIFNVFVGIVIGAVVAISFFFVKSERARAIVLGMVIVGAVLGTQFSEKALYPRYLGWEFERDIKKQPLFDLIAKYHPQAFKDFIQKVNLSLREKADLNRVSAYSADLLNQIFYKHLEKAPDEPIYIYLKATLDLYRYLYTLDPRAVLKLENANTPVSIDLNEIWKDNTFQVLLGHVLESKKLIIEASVQTPVNPPSDAVSNPLVTKIIDELVRQFGQNVVQSVFSTTTQIVPPQVAAQLIIEFYMNITALGKENAGIIMRHIAAIKQQKIEEMDKNIDKNKEK